MKCQVDLFYFDKAHAEFGTKARIIKLINTYVITYTLKNIFKC